VSKSAAILEDLYSITFEDIVDYLGELGDRLDLDTNPCGEKPLKSVVILPIFRGPVLEAVYRSSPLMLRRQSVREIAELRIGVRYLEGWVRDRLIDGRDIEVRAMGSRSAHVIAGNVPVVAIITLLRSAITRNDAIVKSAFKRSAHHGCDCPNDDRNGARSPADQTLVVGYWKGGDERVEQRIYQPRISRSLLPGVEWHRSSTLRNIFKPGIELITLDPKTSTTLIGREALADDATMREVARRAAADLGGLDRKHA